MHKGKVHCYTSKIHYKDLDMYSVMYHPRYFELADSARNQAFKDNGYSIEEQLGDKVGFTVAGIDEVTFKRPLFMGEDVSIFSEVIEVSSRSCMIRHWMSLSDELLNIEDPRSELVNAVFIATYTLVFVSIDEIGEYPLNGSNIKRMKVVSLNDKAKKTLAGFMVDDK